MSIPAETVPIWEEPPRGASADASLLALSGYEQLRSFVDGRSPAPPVARLTGRRLSEVEEGRVVYALPVSDWLVGPKGSLHPAVIAFLADAPLLAAVHSTLPPGTITTTAEVSMTFLGTAMRGDELRAEGRMIHADSSTGLSEVFVTRRDGRLVGHGTSRVFIFPPIPQDGEPELEPRPEPGYDTPDPYLRPVEGGALAPGALDECSGLELLTGQLAGRFPRAPIDLLTGIRLTAAEEGRAEFRLKASGWCANEFGTVYGGILALLAGSAGSAAVQTIAAAGTRFTALDMKLNIIRPVAADGDDLVAAGTVVHGGRQLAIASTEIVNGSGKRVAVATGTTMLGAAAAAHAASQAAGVTF
jgi:uncharacterized protein (TIGR00369 family)